MTIYSLDVLLFLFGTSLLFHVSCQAMFTMSTLDEDAGKTTNQPLQWYPCSPIIKIALLFTPQIKEEISESYHTV